MNRHTAIAVSAFFVVATVWVTTRSDARAEEETPPPPAIEELMFHVDEAGVDQFLQLDDAIWTAHLAEQQGFLGKEVWRLDAKSADGQVTVKLVIRWKSRADWNAVPRAGLEATESRFAEAMSDIGSYELVKVRAYELARTGVGTPAAPIANLDVSEALADATLLARAAEIQVDYTPDFGPNRRYRALPFADVLRYGFAIGNDDPEETTLVLSCADGYEPTMSLADALAADGWLAFEDLDLTAGETWTVGQSGGKRVPASPAYLVWRNADEGRELPWPYALVEIRLLRSDPLDAVAAPRDKELHDAGFRAYKQHCAKCHRLYGVGGRMGPELASPRNVTTYWRREHLTRFIRNPAAYRRGSSMPAMPHLSGSTIESIVSYLGALESER